MTHHPSCRCAVCSDERHRTKWLRGACECRDCSWTAWDQAWTALDTAPHDTRDAYLSLVMRERAARRAYMEAIETHPPPPRPARHDDEAVWVAETRTHARMMAAGTLIL